MLGRMVPWVGAGLELYECPISFGFHDPVANGLLAAYNDREAGIVPPWGQGSALYHVAMHWIHQCRLEREAELMKPALDQAEKNKPSLPGL